MPLRNGHRSLIFPTTNVIYRYTIRILAVILLTVLALTAVAKDITLRFTVWDGDESLKVIRKVLQEFEASHPGIKVKLENFPDYATYHQKMLVQYAGNTAPDVAMMDMGHFQALAVRKALLPLNDFFAKTPGFDIKEYYEPIVKAHTLDGNLYVLPRDIASEGLIYFNKRAFDEAGILYPDGSWTWDFKERPELKEKDFLWVMHKLTKFGPDGKPTRYGFTSGWPGEFMDTLAYSYGLTPWDNVQHPTKLMYDTPEMAKVYNFYLDLANKQKWVPSNQEVTSVLQASTQTIFVQEKAAMYQDGIWQVPNVRRDNKLGSKNFFPWDICLFPAYANGHRGTPTGGSGYSIFSSTKYPKEAWELTRYMSGPIAMAAMARAGIAQPAIRKVALSDAWLPGPNTPPEQMWPQNRIATDKAVPYVVFSPTSEFWPEASSMYEARRGSIVDKIISVEEGLKLGNQEGQKRLDMLRREESLSPFNWPAGIAVGVAIAAAVLFAIYWPERKIKYTSKEKQESLAAYKFLAPWLIGMVVFTVGPMILSLLMSFMRWDMILPAQWRGFHNYTEAFVEDERFWISLKVTAVYTLVSTPVGIIAALLLALLMNQKVKGIPLFRAMYYIPSIASAVAMTLVTRKILSPESGLLNTILYNVQPFKALGIGHAIGTFAGKPDEMVNWLANEKTALASVILISLFGVGGSMVILLAGLQGIPQYYYEAATVDGATPFTRMKAITLPLLTPAIFFSLITGFIGSFQVFTQVFIITNGDAGGGPNHAMLVYMIALYSAAFQNLRMGYAAALAWVLFFIIMIFTLIQLKMSKWVYYESDAK
jgi:ABC-type sugar transport system permease subunit/ABC-type glycerol-3-phosphate transport system substrate-binding protein